MTKKVLMSLVLLAGAACVLAADAPAPLLPLDDFLSEWKISRDFTIAVAQAMPAEAYEFKPVPEEMSFGQQMAHIAMANCYRFAQISGTEPPIRKRPDRFDKETVLAALAKSFDYVLEVLPKITPAQMEKPMKVGWPGRPEATGRQMMLNMFVHTAHHRAQCEVYLRIKGIKPPQYTF